jgi:hypothetical protein
MNRHHPRKLVIQYAATSRLIISASGNRRAGTRGSNHGDLADEIRVTDRIGLVARDDASEAAAGDPDDGNRCPVSVL